MAVAVEVGAAEHHSSCAGHFEDAGAERGAVARVQARTTHVDEDDFHLDHLHLSEHDLIDQTTLCRRAMQVVPRYVTRLTSKCAALALLIVLPSYRILCLLQVIGAASGILSSVHK